MVKTIGKFLAAGIAGGVLAVGPAQAQTQAQAQAQANSGKEDAVEYTFEAGDTLYGLAREFFVTQEAARRVQRLNGISNDRAIPVGEVITVPRALLKSDPVPVRVGPFTGRVEIKRRGNTRTPEFGELVRQSAVISTGPRSFISLTVEGKNALSLPSNSTVQIRSAKRYRINNALDVDLRVLRGRGEIRAPKLREGERFRTGTPVAVTAVRGTEFRVAFDEASTLALTEVTEGLVDISAEGSTVAAPAGQGLASNASGLGQPESLLGAPEISDRSAIQTRENVEFSIKPLPGAVNYRTQIAADVTFIDVIDEQVSPGLDVTFGEVPDGRYSVRSRAIAQNGLEGFWQGEDASFRRKRVGTSAAAEPAPFADAFKFAWLPEGSGPSYTAFQMWPKGNPQELIVDEVGLDSSGVYISDLASGVYSWRVATSVIDEGEVIKVWTEPRDLTVSD